MRRLICGTALLVLFATALTACGADEAEKSSPLARGGTPPVFDGPWASEFAEAYQTTGDPMALKVLAKGVITDSDFTEVGDEFVRCMARKKFKVVITAPDGSFDVRDTELDGNDPRLRSSLKACSRAFDVISGLRAQILRNPEHQDENTIVAECLVRRGVVDKGYTAKDYARELADYKFSFNNESADAMACSRDPLDLTSKKG